MSMQKDSSMTIGPVYCWDRYLSFYADDGTQFHDEEIEEGLKGTAARATLRA